MLCSQCKRVLDRNKSPRVLPCLHIICSGCLTMTANTIECPVCKMMTPDVSVCAFHILHALDEHSSEKERKDQHCHSCGESAIFGCETCNTAWCTICKLCHEKSNKTHHFKVLYERVYCQNHNKRKEEHELYVFCHTDREAICKKCLDKKHYGHHVEDIKTAVCLERNEECVRERCKMLHQRMCQMDTLAKQQTDVVTRKRAHVEDNFNNILSSLLKYKEKRLAEIDVEIKNELSTYQCTLTHAKEQVATQIQKSESVLELISNALKYNTVAEKYVTSQIIDAHLHAMFTEPLPTHEFPTRRDFKTPPALLDTWNIFLPLLGTVQLSFFLLKNKREKETHFLCRCHGTSTSDVRTCMSSAVTTMIRKRWIRWNDLISHRKHGFSVPLFLLHFIVPQLFLLDCVFTSLVDWTPNLFPCQQSFHTISLPIVGCT